MISRTPNPLAASVRATLNAQGSMSALQIAANVDQPIEAVYGALVELEADAFAFIADPAKVFNRQANARARLWSAKPDLEGIPHAQ